jgi:hypothetical protein
VIIRVRRASCQHHTLFELVGRCPGDEHRAPPKEFPDCAQAATGASRNVQIERLQPARWIISTPALIDQTFFAFVFQNETRPVKINHEFISLYRGLAG